MEANREENAKEVLRLCSSKVRILSVELILLHVWSKGRGEYCGQLLCEVHSHGVYSCLNIRN